MERNFAHGLQRRHQIGMGHGKNAQRIWKSGIKRQSNIYFAHYSAYDITRIEIMYSETLVYGENMQMTCSKCDLDASPA